MFAVVRTGGKQYRVAAGDKIVVEKLDGNAGDRITLGDVLLAGDGSDLKSTDGLTVAAEIVAQAKADKVTVFKKRRRHNYRRKKGHRQQHTILKIVAIGDQKEEGGAKPAAGKAEGAKPAKKTAAPASETPAASVGETPAASANPDVRGQIDTAETANPAPDASAKPKAAKSKSASSEGGDAPSTDDTAPAKGAAKKGAKASKSE
jgi:large subunit ribosomal protein L21